MSSTLDHTQRREAVVAAITKVVGNRFRETDESSWAFVDGASPALRGSARLTGDWLVLRAPLAGGRMHGCAVPACAWELAEQNGRITGSAKALLGEDEACVSWGVEIPLVEEVDLADRLELGYGALAEAAHGIGQRSAGTRVTPRGGCSLSPVSELVRLAEWPSNERDERRVSVSLDTVPTPYSAVVERIEDGAILASVAIGLDGELSEASRRAVGMLLLHIGATVRMVRGSIRGGDDGPLAALEATLPDRAAASELNHALAALSVAARRCAAELSAVCDPQIARELCLRQQWPLPGPRCVGHASLETNINNERRTLCPQH